MSRIIVRKSSSSLQKLVLFLKDKCAFWVRWIVHSSLDQSQTTHTKKNTHTHKHTNTQTNAEMLKRWNAEMLKRWLCSKEAKKCFSALYNYSIPHIHEQIYFPRKKHQKGQVRFRFHCQESTEPTGIFSFFFLQWILFVLKTNVVAIRTNVFYRIQYHLPVLVRRWWTVFAGMGRFQNDPCHFRYRYSLSLSLDHPRLNHFIPSDHLSPITNHQSPITNHQSNQSTCLFTRTIGHSYVPSEVAATCAKKGLNKFFQVQTNDIETPDGLYQVISIARSSAEISFSPFVVCCRMIPSIIDEVVRFSLTTDYFAGSLQWSSHLSWRGQKRWCCHCSIMSTHSFFDLQRFAEFNIQVPISHQWLWPRIIWRNISTSFQSSPTGKAGTYAMTNVIPMNHYMYKMNWARGNRGIRDVSKYFWKHCMIINKQQNFNVLLLDFLCGEFGDQLNPHFHRNYICSMLLQIFQPQPPAMNCKFFSTGCVFKLWARHGIIWRYNNWNWFSIYLFVCLFIYFSTTANNTTLFMWSPEHISLSNQWIRLWYIFRCIW